MMPYDVARDMPRAMRYYDGVAFTRMVPGFLVQVMVSCGVIWKHAVSFMTARRRVVQSHRMVAGFLV